MLNIKLFSRLLLRQMFRQRMGSTKWAYHKECSFAIVYVSFWKFCFSIRTCCRELVWSTNYPFILSESARVLFEEAFSLWVSLTLILKQLLETISIQMCHVLWEQFYCSWMYNKTMRNRSQLFKETTWVVKL